MRYKKLELLREQDIEEIKNDTKRKLNMPDDGISNISENLDVDLTTLILRCETFKNFERKREEVKNNEDKVLRQ